MKKPKTIKGAQIPPLTPNDLMPECIRTTKVYDWVMDVNRYTNKTPIPEECAAFVAEALQAGDNLTFECTPPDLDSDDAVCEVLEAVPGSPTGRINVLWTVIVTVTVTNETTGLTCDFEVPVQFDDEYAVCLPEPFTADNVTCQITQVNCSVTNTVLLGNQVQVSVTVCKDIQIEEEVKLEVLGKFCQPRPNDIPVDNGVVDECPGFEFPPQCPDIFPRPPEPPPVDECPCKFRLGIQGNQAPAVVNVTIPEEDPQQFTGTINVSAVQCFTAAAMCNPAVDNFSISFGDDEGNTINFTQGRRTEISCEDGTVAMLEGTAQAAGNVLDGDFTVDLQLTIVGNMGTWVISATGEDGSTFTTTFMAQVSQQTFIGDCTDTVGP